MKCHIPLLLLFAASSLHAAGLPAIQEGHVIVLPQGESVTLTTFVDKLGKPHKEATRVTLRWDAEGLELVFDCTDSAIADAVAVDRDSTKTWKDDCVTLWLDPGHTHNTAGKLTMLQLGASGAFHDARDSDMAYNARGAKAAATRTADGWQGTIHVPWQGLGVEAPKPGEVWGANLTRIDHPGAYEPTKSEYTSWAPIGRKFVQLDRWGHFLFTGPDNAGTEPARAALLAAHASRARDLRGNE